MPTLFNFFQQIIFTVNIKDIIRLMYLPIGLLHIKLCIHLFYNFQITATFFYPLIKRCQVLISGHNKFS